MFFVEAHFVMKGATIGIDHSIIHAVSSLEQSTLTKVMMFVSWIGSVTPVIVLSIVIVLILLFKYKSIADVLVFFVASGGSLIINKLLKHFYQRERPNIIQLVHEGGYSFPSGHTMGAFTFYCVVTYLLWRHIHRERNRIILLVASSLMILSIGFSRIYLGAHFPSDIVGGVLISSAWLMIVIFTYRIVQQKLLETNRMYS